MFKAGPRFHFSLKTIVGLTSVEQEKRLASILETERREGIDLEKPPLMRIRLIRLEEDLWRCVRSHHHILTDEWCTSPLFVEFRDAYAALIVGRPLPEHQAYQFRDYFAWLNQQDLAAPEAFWRSYLKGFREPTPLVIDVSLRTRDTPRRETSLMRKRRLTADRRWRFSRPRKITASRPIR